MLSTATRQEADMDEDTARTLLAQAVALDRELAVLFATIPGAELRRRFDRAVGDVMGAIAREPILPVERLHPTLRPGP